MTMEPRFDLAKVAPGIYHAMRGFEKYLDDSGLDPVLGHLIKLRVSQINGCAFCIDMHWKDLRAAGEGEKRLYGLSAWREAAYYTDRERAALAWAETVTLVAQTHIPDEAWDEVRAQWSEKEVADLTLAIVSINAWNRLAIAARMKAGDYQPPAAAAPKRTP